MVGMLLRPSRGTVPRTRSCMPAGVGREGQADGRAGGRAGGWARGWHLPRTRAFHWVACSCLAQGRPRTRGQGAPLERLGQVHEAPVGAGLEDVKQAIVRAIIEEVWRNQHHQLACGVDTRRVVGRRQVGPRQVGVANRAAACGRTGQVVCVSGEVRGTLAAAGRRCRQRWICGGRAGVCVCVWGGGGVAPATPWAVRAYR
jgi:hypothetical protein